MTADDLDDRTQTPSRGTSLRGDPARVNEDDADELKPFQFLPDYILQRAQLLATLDHVTLRSWILWRLLK